MAIAVIYPVRIVRVGPIPPIQVRTPARTPAMIHRRAIRARILRVAIAVVATVVAVVVAIEVTRSITNDALSKDSFGTSPSRADEDSYRPLLR